MVNPSALRHPNFDYVALGHIHRQQLSYGEPPIAYSGSINRVDFSEEKEAKGFWVTEIRPGRADPQFVEVRARPFETVEVTPDGDDPTEGVLRALRRREHRLRGAVVRLIVELTPEQDARLDEMAVRRALEGTFYVAPIQRRVERPHRERLPGILAGPLTPLDALRRYFEATGVPAARRDVLLEHAERLLQGEPAPADDA